MKNIKYLFAYILPTSAILAMLWLGAWAWATPILTFVLLPILEQILPKSKENYTETEENSRLHTFWFDLLLYLNAPLLFGIVIWYFQLVSASALSWSELTGLTFGTGIIIGALGINIAHELGHRNTAWEQDLSKLMLMVALYQHFFIEHNRGHHKHVATDLDPASARKGENVFGFWIKSVSGSMVSAWHLEKETLVQIGKPFWSIHNAMLRFMVYQALWLGGVYFFFGAKGLLAAIIVAVIGFLLLESINYVEHYGLRRKMLDSGRYEPVSPQHSWNSNHEMGRILLYELTRHSDHHYKSTRKYQILRHIEESPQLPFGYPASIILALCPPLWFAVMDKRV